MTSDSLQTSQRFVITTTILHVSSNKPYENTDTTRQIVQVTTHPQIKDSTTNDQMVQRTTELEIKEATIDEEYTQVTDNTSNKDITWLNSTQTPDTLEVIISTNYNSTTQDSTWSERTDVINDTQDVNGQSTSRRHSPYNSINVLYQVLKIMQLFDKYVVITSSQHDLDFF